MRCQDEPSIVQVEAWEPMGFWAFLIWRNEYASPNLYHYEG